MSAWNNYSDGKSLERNYPKAQLIANTLNSKWITLFRFDVSMLETES